MAGPDERLRRQQQAIANARARINQRAEASIVGASDVSPSQMVGPSVPPDIQERQQAAIARAREATAATQRGEQIREAFEDAPEVSLAGVRSIMTPLPESAGIMERIGRGAQEFSTSAAGLTAFDPWEFGQMLMEQDPNIGVVQSPEGEYFAVNSTTNKVVSLNKPGISPIDIMQFVGTTATASPAARLPSLATRAAGAGGIQTAIQAGQEAMGGEFDPQDVALDVLTTGAADAAPIAFRGVRDRMRGVTPEDSRMQQTITEVGEAAISEQPSRMARAAREVQPDPGLVESATRLGVEGDVPLSALSGNEQFRAVQAGLTARLGSDLADDQAQSIISLSENVARSLDDYGAAASRGGFDDTIRARIEGDIADLTLQSKPLYKSLKKIVDRFGGKYQEVNTPILNSYFEQINKAYRNTANVPKGVRAVMDQITDPLGITYDALDKLRITTGENYASALRGSNPYPDTDVRTLGQLYDVITRQQNKALENIGGVRSSDIWGSAKALVSQRKQLEELSVQALGKDLSNDIMAGVEQTLANIPRGNIRAFVSKMRAVPEDLRPQAMVTALKGMMQKTARSADVDKDFVMSTSFYPNWWRQVKSDPKVFNLVTEYLDPEQVRFFDDVARIGGSLQRSIQKQPMNGRLVEFVDNFDKSNGLISRLIGTARTKGGPIIGPIAGSMGAVFDVALGGIGRKDAMQKMSNLLRSEGFRQMVLRGASGEPTERVASRVTQGEPFQQWYNSAAEPIKNGIMELGRVATESLPNPSPERILSAGAAEYFTRSNFDEIEQYFTGEE